jgi:MoxR-like ATPase
MCLFERRVQVSHRQWQSLTGRYSAAELAAKKIVPVSPQFLVIALGVAVPKYRGFPLDPPLRSRFQCRKIDHPSSESEFELLSAVFPSISHAKRVELVKIAATLRALADKGLLSNSLCFSSESLLRAASLISCFPHMRVRDALTRMLPAFAVENLLLPADNGSWSAPNSTSNSWSKAIRDVSADCDSRIPVHYSPTDYASDSPGSATIFQEGFEPIKLSLRAAPNAATSHFTEAIVQQTMSPSQRILIARVLQDVSAGSHVAILGPSGCGKSSVLKRVCAVLGMPRPLIMHLYRDMTSRDLLLRRVSLEDGSTAWEPSLLVQAAQAGLCIVLDGVHHLQSDTLSSDGRMLIRHDRWMKLRELVADDDELLRRGVFPILPSFQVFATSCSVPVSSSPAALNSSWMTSETSTLWVFLFVR